MKILLAGLPGSGKTTQAVKLSKELGLDLVRTGDIFREMAEKKNSELADKVRKIMSDGGLVDDDLVVEIVRQKVQEDEIKGGFVMDGYPRTVEQIKKFDPEFDYVFYLNISEDEIRRRLSARGRLDDAPDVISNRLKAQEENMMDVLGFYKQKCEVHEINAERTIGEVHALIRSFLS